MSKHTPGPWTVGTSATCSVWVDEIQVASCDWRSEDGSAPDPDYRVASLDEREANARLIAAAPDLLVAAIALCRKLSEYADDGLDVPGERLALEAAIRKAEEGL